MRLLLVEDEKKVCEFVARGLRDELYAVDICQNGESAWEMIQSAEYRPDHFGFDAPGIKRDGIAQENS